jgi:DNA mismatch repair ATPase MutS
MTTLETQYKKIKDQYPNTVIWFTCRGFIECFNECAEHTAKVCGLAVTKKDGFINKLAGFNGVDIDVNMTLVLNTGFKVALVDLNPSE